MVDWKLVPFEHWKLKYKIKIKYLYNKKIII